MLTPFVTSLTDRQLIAENTLEFSLLRPDGFNFQAGQHINVKLTELLFEDKKAGRRTFTIASAPFEDTLRMTTRLTDSGFKKTLAEGPEQQVEIFGPLGAMVRDASRPAVLIAGGVGITPFQSMVLDAIHRGLEEPMHLFYLNRSLATAAYHEQFVRIAEKHPGVFTYVPSITGEIIPEFWTGERQRLNHTLIKKYVEHVSAATFYVCGPPPLVTDLTNVLKSEGIDQERILSESFWGYS